MQEREDEGKKVGKKGLFELSLCAKQLPELPGRRRRREEEISLLLSLSLSLFPYVSPTSPIPRALGNRETRRVNVEASSSSSSSSRDPIVFESHNRASRRARERTRADDDDAVI